MNLKGSLQASQDDPWAARAAARASRGRPDAVVMTPSAEVSASGPSDSYADPALSSSTSVVDTAYDAGTDVDYVYC